MKKIIVLNMILVAVIALSCIRVTIKRAEGWESPTSQSLWNVWCSGYGYWAVGSYGTIIWYNPAVNEWEVWTPSLTSSSLYSVFMRAQNDGWIVGAPPYYGQPPTILRWTGYPPYGGGWNTVTAPPTVESLIDVWAVSANDAWAVGSYGVIFRWDGTSWNTVSSPTGKALWSIHMVSPTDGWAVGGDIIHWDGASWSTWSNPTSKLLMSVYMVDANNGWATGAGGTILHWDGASWQTMQSPTTQNLYGVTMTGADSGYAVGGRATPSGNGTIIRWDGTRWRPCTITNTSYTLRSVDMISDNIGGWVVGDVGTIIRVGYDEIVVQYELTITGSIGSGTTSPAPSNSWHDKGSNVSVTAIPQPGWWPEHGWKLDHWELDSVNVGSANPYSVTMEADHSLTAVFTELPPPVIESCDSTGEVRNAFEPTETVYMNGTGFAPSTTYNIYVVNDVTTWTDGMLIPQRIPGTATTVSTNISGSIPPIALWAGPLTPGKYDIALDIDGDGLYDEGVDILDNNDIEVTAGVAVIPEFLSSLMIPLLLTTTLLTAIARKKRLPQPIK